MSIGKTIKPLPGFIVIEEVEAETKTASGLELPDTAQEKPQFGKVIAKGDALPGDSFKGNTRDLPVKAGDTIAFKKYTGHPMKVEGKEYQVVHFDDAIAVIE